MGELQKLPVCESGIGYAIFNQDYASGWRSGLSDFMPPKHRRIAPGSHRPPAAMLLKGLYVVPTCTLQEALVDHTVVKIGIKGTDVGILRSLKSGGLASVGVLMCECSSADEIRAHPEAAADRFAHIVDLLAECGATHIHLPAEVYKATWWNPRGRRATVDFVFSPVSGNLQMCSRMTPAIRTNGGLSAVTSKTLLSEGP